MSDGLAAEHENVWRLVGYNAGGWDVAGEIPRAVLTELGAGGVLCAEVPKQYGGLGMGSRESGELSAYVGSLCSSLRSVMTSQGMAGRTGQSPGTPEQRAAILPGLTRRRPPGPGP